MLNKYLKGNLTRSPAEFDTSLKGEKKGFISRKLVDVSWTGGLSDDLTPNRVLRDQLLKNGVDNLKIEAKPQANCVKISHIHQVRFERWKGNVSYTELPSILKFNTIEMIALHIRSRYMG